MKLARGIRTIALSALILSSNSCTTDGGDSVETVEEENRVPDQGEDALDADLPTAEAASAEAASQGEESIDSNSTGDVQNLATEQQLAVDESTNSAANGAGQELASAPVPGADGTPMADASPALPEAPIAMAEAPAVSPDMPSEAEAQAESIPTITDVVAASEGSHNDAFPVKAKKSQKAGKKAHAKSHKSSQHKETPALSGDEKLYIVQPGDTLGSIATTLYGTSAQWKNLADLNGLDSKGRIYPGDSIKYKANEATAAFEARYDGLTKASVTVERGDTLSKIATRVMGQASYWKLLWRWNEAALRDPNKIAVGQNLQYVNAADLEAASSATPKAATAH